jgi:hypothetical protein
MDTATLIAPEQVDATLADALVAHVAEWIDRTGSGRSAEQECRLLVDEAIDRVNGELTATSNA